ncbi:MAG: hypothetical protein AAF235_07865, partial [Planctomycetota bacterium]
GGLARGEKVSEADPMGSAVDRGSGEDPGSAVLDDEAWTEMATPFEEVSSEPEMGTPEVTVDEPVREQIAEPAADPATDLEVDLAGGEGANPDAVRATVERAFELVLTGEAARVREAVELLRGLELDGVLDREGRALLEEAERILGVSLGGPGVGES